jgi:hypothetical protein
MCWGFDCGDGWFDLIDQLSADLAPLGVVATQVKEKYGGLRFYYHCPSETDDKADELVEAAEEKSYTICELCGEPGECNTGPWYRVRCHDCWEVQ